eukprot:1774480-Pyramimonas_sp.AAC.1
MTGQAGPTQYAFAAIDWFALHSVVNFNGGDVDNMLDLSLFLTSGMKPWGTSSVQCIRILDASRIPTSPSRNDVQAS